MAEKMDFYEVMGVLVPGSLLVLLLPTVFPGLAVALNAAVFPEAFKVIALTALAIFVGQVVLALGSLVEPLLFRTFGGRPSDLVFSHGLKGYVLPDAATRIKARLTDACGEEVTDHSLFHYAAHLAGTAKESRVPRFNALYAYHRSLVVLLVVALIALGVSAVWGAASALTVVQLTLAVLGLALLLWLFWYRTRQRACYYVRDVLLTAERVLIERAQPASGVFGNREEK